MMPRALALGAALLAVAVAVAWLRLDAAQDTRAAADLAEARARAETLERMSNAETSRGDPDADREWLRGFGAR